MYPKFRMRFDDVKQTQSFFYIPEAGKIGKLKSDLVAYIYNGEHTGETENQIINSTVEMSTETWAAVTEDNANLVTRVGSHPIRIPH